MNQEMLEGLILQAKINALHEIDELRHTYAKACAGYDVQEFRTSVDALRKAIWKSMFIEQGIREKYKNG